jgi:hypothetical protein
MSVHVAAWASTLLILCGLGAAFAQEEVAETTWRQDVEVLVASTNFADAATLLQGLRETLVTRGETNSEEFGEVLYVLGACHLLAGNYGESRRFFAESVGTCERVVGSCSEEALCLRRTVADDLTKKFDVRGALDMLYPARDCIENGSASPETRGLLAWEISSGYNLDGNKQAAEKYLRAALKLLETVWEPDDGRLTNLRREVERLASSEAQTVRESTDTSDGE